MGMCEWLDSPGKEPCFCYMLQFILWISMDLVKCVIWLTGANLKLENGSEGKSEGNALVSSENKMPESSNANPSSNSSGVPASTKPVAVGSTQQTDMKLPTEVGKEENPTPTPE